MSYKLLRLPLAELQMYFRVSREAFIPGILEVMYPNGYTEEATDYAIQATERGPANHPERHHFFKIVDTDLPESDPFDQVVGISQWQVFPRERTEEEVQREKEQGDRDEQEFGPPPGIRLQARKDFGKAIGACKEKFLGREPYVYLAVLATRPEHQRRGVGSVSMAWGIEKADELGLPAWLEASPKGVALYQKWGFEVVDQLDWDARNYGYDDPLTHVCMLRPSVKDRAPISQT